MVQLCEVLRKMIAVVASGQWAGQVQPLYVDIMQFYAKLNFVKLMGKRWFGFSKVEGEEKKPHSEPASTQF